MFTSSARAQLSSQGDGSGFAANIGVSFKTPEEFFLNAKPEPVAKRFDPRTYLDSDASDGGE